MPRKVGFSDDQDKPLSTADKVVEGYRRKAREKARANADAEQARKEAEKARRATQGPAAVRLFTIIFIFVWLAFWTVGIAFACFAFVNAELGMRAFLSLWLALAVVGWIAAVRKLLTLIRTFTRK